MERSPVISWLFHIRVLCKCFKNNAEALCLVNVTIGTIFVKVVSTEVHNIRHILCILPQSILLLLLDVEYARKSNRCFPFS
jgi:hypothetical protein